MAKRRGEHDEICRSKRRRTSTWKVREATPKPGTEQPTAQQKPKQAAKAPNAPKAPPTPPPAPKTRRRQTDTQAPLTSSSEEVEESVKRSAANTKTPQKSQTTTDQTQVMSRIKARGVSPTGSPNGADKEAKLKADEEAKLKADETSMWWSVPPVVLAFIFVCAVVEFSNFDFRTQIFEARDNVNRQNDVHMISGILAGSQWWSHVIDQLYYSVFTPRILREHTAHAGATIEVFSKISSDDWMHWISYGAIFGIVYFWFRFNNLQETTAEPQAATDDEEKMGEREQYGNHVWNAFKHVANLVPIITFMSDLKFMTTANFCAFEMKMVAAQLYDPGSTEAFKLVCGVYACFLVCWFLDYCYPQAFVKLHVHRWTIFILRSVVFLILYSLLYTCVSIWFINNYTSQFYKSSVLTVIEKSWTYNDSTKTLEPNEEVEKAWKRFEADWKKGFHQQYEAFSIMLQFLIPFVCGSTFVFCVAMGCSVVYHGAKTKIPTDLIWIFRSLDIVVNFTDPELLALAEAKEVKEVEDVEKKLNIRRYNNCVERAMLKCGVWILLMHGIMFLQDGDVALLGYNQVWVFEICQWLSHIACVVKFFHECQKPIAFTDTAVETPPQCLQTMPPGTCKVFYARTAHTWSFVSLTACYITTSHGYFLALLFQHVYTFVSSVDDLGWEALSVGDYIWRIFVIEHMEKHFMVLMYGIVCEFAWASYCSDVVMDEVYTGQDFICTVSKRLTQILFKTPSERVVPPPRAREVVQSPSYKSHGIVAGVMTVQSDPGANSGSNRSQDNCMDKVAKTPLVGIFKMAVNCASLVCNDSAKPFGFQFVNANASCKLLKDFRDAHLNVCLMSGSKVVWTDSQKEPKPKKTDFMNSHMRNIFAYCLLTLMAVFKKVVDDESTDESLLQSYVTLFSYILEDTTWMLPLVAHMQVSSCFIESETNNKKWVLPTVACLWGKIFECHPELLFALLCKKLPTMDKMKIDRVPFGSIDILNAAALRMTTWLNVNVDRRIKDVIEDLKASRAIATVRVDGEHEQNVTIYHGCKTPAPTTAPNRVQRGVAGGPGFQ